MSAEDIIIKLKRGVSGGAQPLGLTHGELAVNTTDARLFVGSLTGGTIPINNRFFVGVSAPLYPVEGDRWYNGTYENVYISGSWVAPVESVVTGVNGITGTVSITSGSNITITQTGKTIMIAAAATPAVLATSSITGVASFPNTDFSVSSLGAVSLTGNVARTHIGQTFTGLQVFSTGLSANSLNIGAGATFNGLVRILGDLLVSGGITTTISENVLIEDNYIILNSNATVADSGGIEVYRGSGNTNRVLRWNESSSAWQFTNDGTNYLNIGAVGSLPIATASTTGVAAFSNADFSVTPSGAVSLTGNVARTHIGQTFTGLQVFSSGLSSAGLTSTQRVNVSSGGIVVQAGGLSVTGGANLTGGMQVFGNVIANAGITSYGGISTPRILFGNTGSNNIGVLYDVDTYDTLSFEGSVGQLFSIYNNLSTGTIFSVNDISGIPSIEVDANGTVLFASFTGNVGIGISSASGTERLHVGGPIRVLGSINATGLLSAQALNMVAGATFGTDIYAPNLVTGVNGITGAVTIASGSNVTITQSGKMITINATSLPAPPAAIASSSVTGVASFPNADFSISSVGAVSLTGNVARTHIGQTFTGLQVFSSGLSSNGLTGILMTASQPNVTSLGTLTSLNTAGLTSSQRVNVSAGGIVVQAGGLSVTGGIAGTLVTPAQTNITSVGVLSGLSVNNGLSVTGGISATGGVNIGGGGISVTGGIAGTVLTPAQPNITSVGTLTSLNSTGLITTTSGLSANNINIASGATFGGAVRILGDLLVSGGITTTISENVLIEDNFIILNSNATVADSGGIEVYRGSGNTNRVIRWNESSSAWQFTNDGTNYLNIGAVGSLPIATASTTGVAFFPHTDFSVTSLGGVSLTGNVARTHIGQTFTGLQVFSSGLSANGLTGTLNTAAQPNITSVGTLTSLTTAGLTSTQRVNVSSGGIVVQAGGLSVTGGISATGGANFYGLVGINASGGVAQDNLMVQGNYGLYGISQHVGGTSQYFNIRSSHSFGNVVGYHRYDIWPWGSHFTTWVGRPYGGSDTQNAYTSSVVDDTTGYPNQNTHTTFNVRDFGARSDAVIYIGSGSSGGNTRPSLYAEQGAVLAASGGNVGIGTNSPSAKLDINGTFRASSNTTLSGGLTTNNLFVSQGTTFASGIAITRGGSEFGTVRLDTSNNLLYNSWNGHIFQNGSVERLRIDPASGFVGIGTNSPTQAIDVSGNAAVRGSLFVANGVSVTGGITGTINTAAQPNITSLGTLTSLNTAGITSTQRVTISSGGLSVAGNIDGTIGTAAQPNITSLGSLTTLTTAGLTSTQRVNVSSGGIVVQAGGLSVTGGTNLTGGSTFFGDIEVYDGAFIRTGGLSVTGGIAGTLVTPAQTNITSVGTLTSLNTAGMTSTERITISNGGMVVYGIATFYAGVNGTILGSHQPQITSLGNLLLLNTAGLTSSQRVNVTSGGIVVQDGGLSVTGGMSVTGSTIQFSSSNTNAAAVTINAPSLNPTPSVGALAINSPEPDIYLNDTNGGWATINIADAGVERIAFGKNNGNDFYLAVRDPSVIAGAWRDEAFVVDSSTGVSRFGFSVGISGALVVTGGANITGGATFGGTLNVQKNNINQPNLQAYTEPTNSGSVSSNIFTCDLSTSQIFRHTLSTSITRLNVINIPTTPNVAVGFTLIVKQSAAGGLTFAFDGISGATALFPASYVPIMSAAANKTDIVSYVTYDNGSNWFGFGGEQAY